MMIQTTESKQSAAIRAGLLEKDERLAYIEREKALAEFSRRAEEVDPTERMSRAFEAVCDEMTPLVYESDRLLGHMVEGYLQTEEELPVFYADWKPLVHHDILFSPGHMTLDHETVILQGLRGIRKRAESTADRLGTEQAECIASNARIIEGAVGRLAARFAEAARRMAENLEGESCRNLLHAADAMENVPVKPARNFKEALQCAWSVHWIASCILGGRDFGWGRFDQYLLPFYKRDIEAGTLDQDDALALMVDFLFKANEIAGNARGLGAFKPTPPQSSKQYLFIGGVDASGNDQSNEVSMLVLDAARTVRMREPVINVRWHPEVASPLKGAAAQACVEMQGQIQFCNDKLIPGGLIRRGIDPQDAWNYAASGCSRIDAGPNHGNHEAFIAPVHALLEAVENLERLDTIDALIEDFSQRFQSMLQLRFEQELKRNEPYWDTGFINEGATHFHIESLFINDCVDRGLNLCQGGSRYVLHPIHIVGFATLVDSFVALEKMVCSGEMELPEFKKALSDNFQGHDALRVRLKTLPSFGNDIDEVDEMAERLAEIIVSRIEALPAPEGHHVLPSFYSLLNHRSAGRNCPATPDGRRAGEPLSENQSPTYGRTKEGITALMNSLWRLPFDRAACGGLNVMLMGDIQAVTLRALIDTYFSKGGSIIGPTFADRATLLDARENPERHADLLVRIHGFSDWFVGLPEEEQAELIARTNY